MADPFVQKMMARSQARRAVMGKGVSNLNKENLLVSDTTRSRLNQISTLYTDSPKEGTDPLKPSNSEPEPSTSSYSKTTHSSPEKVSVERDVNKAGLREGLEVPEPSHNKQRLGALARRCQEMRNWDDDYTYHSSSHGSQEAQGFTPSDSRSKLYYNYKDQERQKQRPSSPQKQRPSSPQKQHPSSPQKQHPSSPQKQRPSSPQKEQPHPSVPEVETSPVSPSKVSGISLAEFFRSTSPSKTQDPPASACMISSNSKSSPPKRPSSSILKSQRSSPLKSAGSNPPPPPPPPPNSSSPCKPSMLPVVVSCVPKSPRHSPTRQLARVPSPEPKSVKDHGRDQSPSKVREIRSRWEQHIRQASPERTDRSRSPCKSNPTPQSPRKMTSVASMGQIRQSSSSDMQVFAGNRSSSSSLASQHSPTRDPDQSEFSRGRPERRSWRPVSPHKPRPVGEVVKGAAPVPQAAPIVNKPFTSSVRERAAAFDNAGERVPVKDPAEMTVQERLAIFSKKQSGALIPKAPFGQSVPVKTLHSESSSVPREVSKPTVAYSHPVQKPTKSVASAPPADIIRNLDGYRDNRSPSPEKDFVSQKNIFEHIKDNWRGNEINSKIQTERQKEMDTLMNRFKKPKPVAELHDTCTGNAQSGRYTGKLERPRYPEESESDYQESDDSIIESTTSENPEDDVLSQDTDSGTSGPPKPPRLFLDTSAPSSSHHTHTKYGGRDNKTFSPTGRLNSTEIGEVRPSPKKEFIPKVKPGCLFPSLSDIESHSEAPDSQDEDDIKDSSFAESVLTCASMESLGQKIQRTAHGSGNKTLSMIAEATASHTEMKYDMSESTMDALGAIDDAIDEALTDDPTPPKRLRVPDDIDPNVYKTPKINSRSPVRQEEEQDSSLAHSISMYRRQKPDVTYTPVRQIIRRPDLRSPTPDPVSPSVTVSARIKVLHDEVLEQQRVIAQASNAVTVVLQHPEHQGKPEHVEAEKLLLLASQKRQTALNEIQRIKAEGALGQQSWGGDEETCMGSISIGNISVPLKHDFLHRGMKGDEIYHLLVLVKHREQVISSQLVKTPECVTEEAITFPNLMALHHLTSDFNITLEVYSLCTHHSRHHAIKKEPSRMKLTPLKRLQKHDSRVNSPSVQSPGGPFAVRTSDFQLVGFTHLNIATLTRNAWTLEKVPFSSPLDGHLLMTVRCSFEGGISERGFLTMFEDVGGYGAWNRRWCALSGMHLRYWRYPDDETKKEPSGLLDLRSCTTRRVELVSRDVCARQYTFQLTFMSPAHPKDITNLVQEVKGQSLVTKVLLSSDSKEERIMWCNKLNKSLANIRAWDPDALGPEDYQV